MDPRFPPLAPPEPMRARVLTLPRPDMSALPLAEWAVFGGLLVAVLLLR